MFLKRYSSPTSNTQLSVQLPSWPWNRKNQWLARKYWCQHWRSSSWYGTITITCFCRMLNLSFFVLCNLRFLRQFSFYLSRLGYRSVPHRYIRGYYGYVQRGQKCMQQMISLPFHKHIPKLSFWIFFANVLYNIFPQGGLAPGGFNFDAKL